MLMTDGLTDHLGHRRHPPVEEQTATLQIISEMVLQVVKDIVKLRCFMGGTNSPRVSYDGDGPPLPVRAHLSETSQARQTLDDLFQVLFSSFFFFGKDLVFLILCKILWVVGDGREDWFLLLGCT